MGEQRRALCVATSRRARKEEATQDCVKKTAKIAQGLVGGVIIMSEVIVNLVKATMPDAEVVKVYQDDSGLKVDINLGGTVITGSIKKNHAGALYIE